jgi:AcrR family transcriptional regulator
MQDDSKKTKDSRSCLIHSASKLFAKLGLDKTSTRDIAQDSKVNISMISYHFGGKEGLYKQVLVDFAKGIEKNVSLIQKRFIEIKMTKATFIEEVSAIVDEMIQTRIAHPEICTLLSREKIEGLPMSREVHEQIFAPIIQNFLSLIKKAQEKNIVKKDISPILFFIFMTEGLWGFFEMASCQTKLFEDCAELVHHPIKLRNQIIKIYLEGILL